MPSILLLLCVLIPQMVAAGPLLEINEQDHAILINPYLEIFPDPTGKLSFEQISSSPYQNQFVPGENNTLNFGYSNLTHWVRFEVVNRTQITQRFIFIESYDPNRIDYIDLYIPSENGNIITRKRGEARRAELQGTPYDNGVAPMIFFKAITLERDKPITLYLRVQDEALLYFPLKMVTGDGVDAMNLSLMPWTAASGAVLFFMIYNIMVYASLRDRSYLDYALVLLSWIVMMFLLSGEFANAFPNLPLWWLNRIRWLIPAIHLLLMIQFTRSFNKTSEIAPVIDRLLIRLALFYSLWMGLVGIIPYAYLGKPTRILEISVLFLLPIVSGICWKYGFRASKYLFVAQIVVFLTAIGPFLSVFGWRDVTSAADRLLELGAFLLQMLLFAVALMIRFRNLKQEIVENQQRVIQDRENTIIQENQSLKKEIIRRKSIENDLQLTQQRMVRLLDFMEDAVLLLKKNRSIVYVNQVAEQLFEYELYELLNEPLGVIFPDFRDELSRDTSIITEGTTKNGQVRSVHVFYNHFATESEELVALMCRPLDSDTAISSDVPQKSSSNLQTDILHRDSQKIQMVQATFGEMIGHLQNGSDALTEKLHRIDNAIGEELSGLTPIEFDKQLRSNLVDVMQISLTAWKQLTGQEKHHLAEESGLWSAYLDKGSLQTRTLDKYLNIEKLPKKPRTQVVLQTGLFVLQTIAEEEIPAKPELELKVNKLRSYIRQKNS